MFYGIILKKKYLCVSSFATFVAKITFNFENQLYFLCIIIYNIQANRFNFFFISTRAKVYHYL